MNKITILEQGHHRVGYHRETHNSGAPTDILASFFPFGLCLICHGNIIYCNAHRPRERDEAVHCACRPLLAQGYYVGLVDLPVGG